MPFFLFVKFHLHHICRNKRSSNKDKKKEEQLQRRFIQLEDALEKQKQTIDSLQTQVEILVNKTNSMQHTPIAPGNKG